MNNPFHYIILFFIITFGVMSGNLLSNFVSIWVTTIGLEEVAKQQRITNADNNRIRQEQELQKAKTSKIIRQQNATGKRLERVCIDWVSMAKTTPTRTTIEGRKKHCDNYNNYIDNGKYKK